MKELRFVNELTICIVTKLWMSPSQPAVMPSSLSNAKARQAVFLYFLMMSKQRIVNPFRLYFLTSFLRAL